MSDKELDNLFKEAADGFKPPNDPSAWQDMAHKLDLAGAVTTSFWNWKTISSTVVVGVTTVGIILYLSVSNLNSEQAIATEKIAASDATKTPTLEKQAADADAKSLSSNDDKASETDRPTQDAKQASNLKSGEQSQRKDAHPTVVNEKRGVDTGVEKNNVAQEENLKATASRASQQNEISAKAIDSQKQTAVSATSEGNSNEVKSGEAKSATTLVGGVVIAGKLLEPTSSVNPVNSEGSINQAQPSNNTSNSTEPVPANKTGSNANDPKSQPSVSESQNPSNEKVENVGNVVVAEKLVEQTSAATVSSESNANQVSSNASDSKTQATTAKSDSLKMMDEQKKEEALPKNESDKVEPKAKEENPSFNRFAIKLAVAPDYSTVKSATPNSLGINYGVLFEYRITKHWSVATGGIWSKKIYSAYDVEYSGYNADRVDGDCRMWDIPVNVYYNFPSSKAFSFYASLGFSSYLMNEENYVYYVETAYGTYDYPNQVKGENNEWFKTLNVSAGMQFRMSQFSLQFEPTLKAPLAGVGEGEVSLVSLGAFFNLRYEIPLNKRRRNED